MTKTSKKVFNYAAGIAVGTLILAMLFSSYILGFISFLAAVISIGLQSGRISLIGTEEIVDAINELDKEEKEEDKEETIY